MKTRIKTSLYALSAGTLAIGAVALAAAAFGVPVDAFANGLAQAVEGVGTGSEKIPQIISIASYGAGGTALIAGGLKLKGHADNPGNTPLSAGLVRVLVGGVLMGGPVVGQNILNTLGAGAGSTGAEFKDMNASFTTGN